MAQSEPKFWSPPTVTCHASAALTGGRFVRVSAAPTGGNPTIAVAAAAGKAFGVLAQDCPAAAKVGVHVGNGLVTNVEAGAAIAVGASVEANASGQAITLAAGTALGMALEAASGAGVQFLCLIRCSA